MGEQLWAVYQQLSAIHHARAGCSCWAQNHKHGHASAKLPFAGAQIGLGFRNEISPKGGLLRVREFCMAEIEHFCDPNDKSYAAFKNVRDTKLVFFSAENQLSTGKTFEMAIGEAVDSKLVDNETLGYFLARTQQFMIKIGMDPTRLRFRQHLR